MAPPSHPPAARRSTPWRLALGALLVAGLSFLAGRASIDESPRQAGVSGPEAPERQPEPWNGPPQQPGAQQPAPAQAQAPAEAGAVAPSTPTPAPRFASPALIERVQQETTVALQAQREVISSRCWPEQPGHTVARPRSVTFQVVFDGQGQEMSRSLAEESGDLPPSVQACLINMGEAVRIQPPGLDLSVTATVELR